MGRPFLGTRSIPTLTREGVIPQARLVRGSRSRAPPRPMGKSTWPPGHADRRATSGTVAELGESRACGKGHRIDGDVSRESSGRTLQLKRR